jgi:hypothetical protein
MQSQSSRETVVLIEGHLKLNTTRMSDQLDDSELGYVIADELALGLSMKTTVHIKAVSLFSKDVRKQRSK